MIIKYLILLLFFISPILSVLNPIEISNSKNTITIKYYSSDQYISKWVINKLGNKFLDMKFDCKVDGLFRTCIYTVPNDQAKQIYGLKGVSQCVVKSNGTDEDCDSPLNTKYYPTPIISPDFNPSTKGGNVNIQGSFILLTGGFLYSEMGEVYIADKAFSETFDPTNITLLDFPKGCGENSLKWENKKIYKYRYASPILNSVDPKTPENVVTLKGDNFCSSNDDVSIIFGGENNKLSPSDWGLDGSIIFKFIPDYSGKIPIKVNASGSISNSIDLIFNPLVLGINSVPESIGGVVSITGIRFDTLEGKAKIDVKIGESDCKVLSYNLKLITCDLKPFNSTSGGKSKDLPISISVDGSYWQGSSIKFSYGIPTLNSFSVAGSTLTLYGFNLGSNTTSKVLLNGFDINAKGITVDKDEKTLNFTLPLNFDKSSVSVSSNGFISNILEVNTDFNIGIKDKPSTAGQLISIQFNNVKTNNIGTPSIEIAGVKDEINGSLVTTHNGYFSNSFLIPSGCGKKNITGIIGNQIAYSILEYEQPNIISCDFYQEYLTCNGSNFSDGEGNITIFISNFEYLPYKIDHNNFTIKLNQSYILEPNDLISISVCGSSSNKIQLGLESKITSGLDPYSFNSTGGVVTIKGYFFKNNNLTFLKCKNENQIEESFNCTFKNSQEYTCDVPLSGPIDKNCSLTFQGQLSNSFISINYLAPIIDSISNNIMISGGIVVIKGSEFYNQTTIVTIGKLNCEIQSIKSNELVCKLAEYDNSDNSLLYDKELNVNITIVNQSDGSIIKSSNKSIFKYSRGGSTSGNGGNSENNSEGGEEDGGDDDDEKSKKLKWLVPTIICPIIFVVAVIFIGPELFRRFYTYPPPKPAEPEPGFIRQPYNPPNLNNRLYENNPNQYKFEQDADAQLSFVPIQP